MTALLDPVDELTRRGLLTGAGALGALALLPARRASSAEDAGSWEFTDDRGVTVSLAQPPQRVVAFVAAAAALWDFGLRPVGIFGPSRREDGSAGDHQVGNLDLDAVTSVGNTFDEFNIERYAALRPDLLAGLRPGPTKPDGAGVRMRTWRWVCGAFRDLATAGMLHTTVAAAARGACTMTRGT